MIDSIEKLIETAHDDPKYIIESGFFVINKNKDTVPFIFNEAQNLFYKERTQWDDIVKAGQLGFSTMIDAILTVKFLLIPNSWSVLLSHEEEATKRLFEKVEFWLQHLPPWLEKFYVPGKTTQGDLVNKFSNSKFYIGTAGARAFGRGDTPHYVHASESSRWRDDGKILTGLIRAVPSKDPHTWFVKETTANGEGTLHHIEYVRAKEGKSKFRAHFIPFFSNPEYRIEGKEISEEDITDTELNLLERFPKEKSHENKGYVNMANLVWRRDMISKLVTEAGRDPEDMFKQEFPVDDVEAFLSSGNPVFSTQAVQNYKAKARKPIAIGNLEGIGENVTFTEEKKGWLYLWDFPTLKGQYIIFADVGETSDFCVATVIDRKTWKVIAKFRTVMQSHAFGDELNKLGHFFNQALMAVEINNMGQSTADRLKTLKYPNLYMRDRLDGKTKKVTKIVGWRTDKKTKPLMIGYMQELVRLEEIDIPDIEILNELSTFVKNEDGTMSASAGNHDDCVMSVSGAYYILKLNPYIRKKEQKTTMTARVRKFRKMRMPKGRGFRR